MSSRYVPNGLGYSYDTMVFTISNKGLYLSKSQKLPQFRLKPGTWLHEGGIASIACHHKAVNVYGFVYRLPVKRLKLVLVVFIGIICF